MANYKYPSWYDKTIKIGTRKRAFINQRLEEKWPFWKVINYANTMFGKKPNYQEPKKPLYREQCEHEWVIEGYEQDVVCTKCQIHCPDCGGYPGLDNICDTCGTYEGIF